MNCIAGELTVAGKVMQKMLEILVTRSAFVRMRGGEWSTWSSGRPIAPTSRQVPACHDLPPSIRETTKEI